MAPDTAVGAKTPATKLDIHPLKPVGAEIFGLDLSQNLDDDTIQAVEAALNTYGVIVFRDQDLGPPSKLHSPNASAMCLAMSARNTPWRGIRKFI
jgi:alpha-ketoglutarate-dependent taurine dioxygenase